MRHLKKSLFSNKVCDQHSSDVKSDVTSLTIRCQIWPMPTVGMGQTKFKFKTSYAIKLKPTNESWGIIELNEININIM